MHWNLRHTSTALVAVALVLFVFDWAGSVPVPLPPVDGDDITDDAGVWEFHPNDNYGSSSSLVVGEELSKTWYAYVRWDLTGVFQQGDVVLSAEMRTKPVQTNGTIDNYMLTAYKVAVPWSEGTVTWNGHPTVNTHLDNVLTTGFAEVAFDVTAAVEAWHTGSSPNYGIRLSGQSSPGDAAVIFPSSERTSFDDRKPTLHIVVDRTGAPDLVIMQLESDDPAYCVGDKPHFSLWVKNQGTAASTACDLAFVLHSDTEPNWADPSGKYYIPIPALDPGESTLPDIDYPATRMIAETSRSWALVDCFDVVSETDESNNVSESVFVPWDLSCWAELPTFSNLAPFGLPDFDQTQQPDWFDLSCGDPDECAFSYCGPTALANALWYLDSKYSAAGTAGDGQDQFSLVRDYNAPSGGTPDDHTRWNVNDLATCWSGPCDIQAVVPPLLPDRTAPASGAELIERIAWVVNTDNRRLEAVSGCWGSVHGCGTEACEFLFLENTDGAAAQFLGSAYNSTNLDVDITYRPAVAEIMNAALDPNGVYLLGFGAYDDDVIQWGHWVTVAGGSVSDLDLIAISDPIRDNAVSYLVSDPTAHGGGYFEPSNHPHIGTYSRDLHNSPDRISRDFYEILPFDGGPGGPQAEIVGYGSGDDPSTLCAASLQFEGLSFRVLSLVRVSVNEAVVGAPLPDMGEDRTYVVVEPNPTSGAVQVKFALRREGLASLRVYDVRGRAVSTLVDGVQASGEHSVAWDGKARDGKRVASGIYFVRLEHGVESEARRIVVLR